MSQEFSLGQGPLPAAAPQTGAGGMLARFARAFANPPDPFEVRLPDGRVQPFGRGAPVFRVSVPNQNGLRALTSLDEGRIGDAYLAGDLDLEGDLLRPFALRGAMADRHLLTAAWRFVQPLIMGQVRTNRSAIASHYDIDPEFFLSFLDPKTPCYTQGVYQHEDETLDVATLRKFEWCFEKLGLRRGDHILEIGPGWGAWFKYASARGVRCTGLTISEVSRDYLRRQAAAEGYDWEILLEDILAYETTQRYDAIVIMGVIEHLPQYLRVQRKFQELLKPGGRVFLDGSACLKKYELSSFMVKHIYPGNHSFLVLHDFLGCLAKTALTVEEMHNDRFSYFLTFRQWARNFDANRDFVVTRFGEFNFRRFRLYLWGATYEFQSRSLDCYRMILRLPDATAA